MEEILKALLKELQELKKELGFLQNAFSNSKEAEEILSVEQAAELLHLSKSAIYNLIAPRTHSEEGNTLPFHKKGHKTIYFLKSEVIAWVRQKPE
ncbi:MAG: helix-turn-helix domain-containing protein [Bacteroidetes bacterium]|nr:helix-turn-helix domain-containing protein [Bacteroidota bacterium]